MRRVAFLAVALLFATSMSHAASVEGYWYGKGYQPLVRKTMQWLTIRRADGTFSAEFREYDDCKVKSIQIEAGRWTVSGNVIANKVVTIDGYPVSDTAYFNDTYKIIELDDRKMRLVHEKSRQEWTLERVAPDFTFPDCKYVS